MKKVEMTSDRKVDEKNRKWHPIEKVENDIRSKIRRKNRNDIRFISRKK